jgi:hypothetical protein
MIMQFGKIFILKFLLNKINFSIFNFLFFFKLKIKSPNDCVKIIYFLIGPEANITNCLIIVYW